jgi:hypothetical protein
MLPATAPVIPELLRLANKDQPITLKLEHMTAAAALQAIAAAGGPYFSMEGPADCCAVDILVNEVPLRRVLELFAAQTDARYEVVSGNRLRVWLPETPIPGGGDGITMPTMIKSVEPDPATQEAHAEGEVPLAVIRRDGRSRAGVLDEGAVARVRQQYRPAGSTANP